MMNLVLFGLTALIGGFIVGYCGAWIHDVIEERKNDR